MLGYHLLKTKDEEEHNNNQRDKKNIYPEIISIDDLNNNTQSNYFVHIGESQLNSSKETNIISTSKYNWHNFIPKILIEQFSKMANFYFLIIAILQSIKEISYSNGQPLILFPLSIVITINGVKDFIEDMKRKRSDDEENTKLCEIYSKSQNQFITSTWSEIKLGDIILVKNDQPFPCDLLILKTSQPNSSCFVQTQSLDGETSLKQRYGNIELTKISNDITSLNNINKVILTSPPNEKIYEFDGRIYNTINSNNINKDSCIVIDNKTIVLRGCFLKQTDYIWGVAIYIGHNTKSMKNSINARAKTSKLEDIINFQILIIFIVQICLALFASVLNYIENINHINDLKVYIYLQGTKEYQSGYTFESFCKRVGIWILIFTNFVPISLLVTMEMIKVVQGIFISWDVDLYSLNKKESAKVQTSTLNEELGQVKYIFTDKTGTLTKNCMKFKKMNIGNIYYGEKKVNNIEGEYNIISSDHYGKIDNNAFIDYQNQFHIDYLYNKNIQIPLFLECISLCHSVISDEIEIKENVIKYNASSSDELALISFARSVGFIFKYRDYTSNITTVEIKGDAHHYKILNIIDFSYERKRMSIIVKLPNDTIRLYSKGADIEIFKRIQKDEDIHNYQKALSTYANEGLRTLVLAYKDISEKDFQLWSKQYNDIISNSPLHKDKLLELYNQIETNLHIIGISAVEDELQSDVDVTLSSFIASGIKIWMLTGDRRDTAKNIALSCKLVSNDSNDIQIDIPENSNVSQIKNILNKYANVTLLKEQKCFLYISTNELNLITNKKNHLCNLFYSIAIKCQSVICSRLTPKQKSKMISFIKSYDKRTILAIGDGANDVKMITKADVGIGIIGKEGTQASRASDYSLHQFSHLKKLLFVHGRESYRKNSFIVCYNFYKNAIFVIVQFWLGFYNFFSGQTLYDRWIYQLYNPIFTCLPIIWYGIADSEKTQSELMNKPVLYIQGIIGKLFHYKRFWKWILLGILNGLMVFVFSFYSLESSCANGKMEDMWGIGTMAYTSIVLIVNLKVFYYTNSHTFISVMIWVLTILSYYFVVLLMSYFPLFYNFDNFNEVFLDLRFVVSTFATAVLVSCFDYGIGRIMILFGYVKEGDNLNVSEIKRKECEDRDNFFSEEKELLLFDEQDV